MSDEKDKVASDAMAATEAELDALAEEAVTNPAGPIATQTFGDKDPGPAIRRHTPFPSTPANIVEQARIMD
jgi:hypothetical protein